MPRKSTLPPSVAVIFRSKILDPPLRSTLVKLERSSRVPVPLAEKVVLRLKPFVPAHDDTDVLKLAPPAPRKPLRAIKLVRSMLLLPRASVD